MAITCSYLVSRDSRQLSKQQKMLMKFRVPKHVAHDVQFHASGIEKIIKANTAYRVMLADCKLQSALKSNAT